MPAATEPEWTRVYPGDAHLTGARAGLVIAAVLFGLAHVANLPIPNRRDALLAGLAYGHVYQRICSISASALTHALVDWVCVALLAGARVPYGRPTAVSVLEDQVRAVEEWLAEESPQALAVETAMGSPALPRLGPPARID